MCTKDILHRIADENDQAAFKIFFTFYHPKLIAFALLFVKSHHHAEDIVSDTLVQLLKRRKKAFKMENFEGYLFMMIKNHSLNYLKKKSNRIVSGDASFDKDCLTSEYLNPLEQILDAELRERITEVVEALPPQRKMVYKLIKDEGLKYKEVAQLMDLSVKTIENHLSAALKDLKQAIRIYLSEKQSSTPVIKLNRRLSTTIATLLCFFLFV